MTVGITDPAAAAATRSAGARRLLRQVRRQPLTLVAAAFVLLLVVVALAAPWLAPYDPNETHYDAVLQGPSSTFLLGTDDLGHDILSRLMYGARVALVVAVGSVLVAMLIGVPYGLLIGYRSGWWDRIGSRGIDIADALPGMLIGFAVIAIFGRGLWVMVLAVGLIFCGAFARMTRAVALTEREKLYVDAARVGGLRNGHILFRQVLPNLIGPLIVQGAVFTGAAIIIESALSFLGLGLASSTPTWGGMLTVAAENRVTQPLLAFPPGLMIVLTVMAYNQVADGINDALTGGNARPTRRQGRAAASAATAVTTTVEPTEVPPLDDGVLQVRGVTVALDRPGAGPVPLVEDAWLSIGRGEIVGLLGESGSGKSMLARSTLGLLPPGIRLATGSVLLDGDEIGGRTEKELRGVRGPGIAVVLQNPHASLSPVHTIGQQLREPLRAHFGLRGAAARDRAVELLDRVGVEDAAHRLDDYPHQFSGGMAQRVAIAMALAAKPKLLIADEATSALDVTTQSQVLDLLLDLRDELDMGILMITHDLGVVAESCDRAAVMYAGQIVEVGDVRSLFDEPHHPYTAALLAANPSGAPANGDLPTIGGRVPLAGEWPTGCHFASRCQFASDDCAEHAVPFDGEVRCLRASELREQLRLEVIS